MKDNKYPYKKEFETPPEYFNQLNDQIFTEINRIKKSEKKNFKLNIIKWSVAASVLVILSFVYLNLKRDNEVKISFNQLEYNEIETYFENHEINEDDLLETIPLEDLQITEDTLYNEIIDELDNDLLFQYN